MSSDRHAFALVLAIVAALGLAGCQVRPLYSSTASEAGPQADLPAIEVRSPDNRNEQVYRNALLFGMRGGGEGAPTRYTLTFRLSSYSQAVAVERGTGIANAYQLIGASSFLLKDATTEENLFGARVTATDSYTRSSQSYSNIRAEKDAQERLAKALAELTLARLAAYFATN